MISDKFLMKKVSKCHSTGCWLWTGNLVANGYGRLGRGRHGKKRNYGAHRYSYEMHVGAIPDGLCVLHKCDVRNCVNPDHLFLGTHDDNMKDCAAKGRIRAPRGEKHGRAKLSNEDVISIRMFLTLGAKGRDIAEAYGVTQVTVSRIKTGKRWRWQLG